MVTHEEVIHSFRALLHRDPESEQTIQHYMGYDDLETLIRALLNSTERTLAARPGPLFNYTATFDLVAMIMRHDNPARQPVAGHRINYLGTAVNVSKFMPALGLENIVEGPVLPNNWHTDISEFAAALRAVELAGDQFTMMELGCGWGCWMNITGTAARAMGKTPFLIGVEGDEGHVAFAHEALATNGFTPGQFHVFRGIAGAHDGLAYFPRQERSGVSWGLEPVMNPTPARRTQLIASGDYDELPMISLAHATAAARVKRLDLLHIDIQGGEADLIEQSLPFLDRHVAYIVIGTHSRVIDGRIIDILLGHGGWALEVERATLFTLDDGQLTTRIDGVQGWRNLSLT